MAKPRRAPAHRPASEAPRWNPLERDASPFAAASSYVSLAPFAFAFPFPFPFGLDNPHPKSPTTQDRTESSGTRRRRTAAAARTGRPDSIDRGCRTPTSSSTSSSATQVRRPLASEPAAPLIPAALPLAGEIGLDPRGWGSVARVSCGRWCR
jgi:hypothetical protein